MQFMRIAGSCSRVGGWVIAAFALAALPRPTLAAAAPAARTAGHAARSPIKHLVIIIGENRTFDHVFATYEPVHGQRVWNLLSEGIVNKDGSPGPNFSQAEQQAASDPSSDAFLLSPPLSPFPKRVLPTPLANGPKQSYVKDNDLKLAKASENGLPEDYYQYLVTGGTGLEAQTPDTRISHVDALPPGPFQLTNAKTFTYDDYSASPVHRFYQMWQQMDCNVAHATHERPSGCDSKLFSWVAVTVGEGGDGAPPPANFSTEYSAAAKTTGEGGVALGFYNVQNGDVPYFKSLADEYAMSDNFHQSMSGGTGMNHVMLGHGDAIWFSDGEGHATIPPREVAELGGKKPLASDEVENPNPAPGTNNWYAQDGYAGGSYSNCADPAQPGVSALVNYLKSLPRPIDPHCEPGHYYLVNNLNPGYFGDGSNAFTDKNPHNTVFTIPPSSTRSIGDELNETNVSWKYYGDQWNNYIPDPYQINFKPIGAKTDEYCNICNPFQYDTSIMTNPAVRKAHIQDTVDLYADIAKGRLPAVSFVKPSALVDGHPQESKLDLFEGFSKKIVDAIKANPKLWKSTAIVITFDEGGGYYDSGYVQPLDFFGDGTRVPLIVVSPYTKAGHISHEYTDHVSILKFIEKNWGLAPVTNRSRDNFPNPVADPANPYVPTNTPAIGDLSDLFDFQNL